MKSISSAIIFCLFLLIGPHTFAREVILVENLASSAEGELLIRILVEKFKLPRELITLRNINTPCELKSEAIIHLCLEASGELQVRRMNQYVVKNSLGVFLNQNEGAGQ